MNELLAKSEELRTERFKQNSEIVKNNILALVRTSLESSKLEDFEPVIEQLTQKISSEFENQKQVHLASYQGIAKEFFQNLVDTLRAANKFCKGQFKNCYSDLGAFLSEELIREEEEESAEEGVETTDGADQEVEQEGAEVPEVQEASDEKKGENLEIEGGESVESASSEETGGNAEEGEQTTLDNTDASSDTGVAESDANLPSEENKETEAQTNDSGSPASGEKALASKARGSKRVSKALFDEALKAYKKNRKTSIRQSKNSKLKNMVVVPIF